MNIWNSMPEQIRSFVALATKVALSRPNTVYEKDAIHALVAQHAEGEAQSFWKHPSMGGRIFGLIKYEPDVCTELAKVGVLAEARDDDRILLVNANWLLTAAERYRHVTDKTVRGRVCRGCGAKEPDNAAFYGVVLVPVDPQKRSTLQIANGMQQLHDRTVYAHALCVDNWLKWVAESEAFANVEAAEEADRAAGLKPSKAPLLARISHALGVA